MTIPFTCPHCSQHTDVDARHAGRMGPCVNCGNTITIPTFESVATATSPQAFRRRRPWWIATGIIMGTIAAVVVTGIVVVSILRPAFLAAREAARCAACESNLNRIALALEDYYVDNGHYPPAVVYDASGTPKHSWRVLLLPYLGPECERIHELYDHSEPWDGPHNTRLVSQNPAVYQCPSDIRATVGETSYLAVVGSNTVINNNPNQPTSREDITDDRSQTLVVIESGNSTTNWLQPKDIGVDQLRAGLNSSNAASPGSNHMQGVNALMVDSSIARIPDTAPAIDLRAMATIDGDEFIETLDDLEY